MISYKPSYKSSVLAALAQGLCEFIFGPVTSHLWSVILVPDLCNFILAQLKVLGGQLYWFQTFVISYKPSYMYKSSVLAALAQGLCELIFAQ